MKKNKLEHEVSLYSKVWLWSNEQKKLMKQIIKLIKLKMSFWMQKLHYIKWQRTEKNEESG